MNTLKESPQAKDLCCISKKDLKHSYKRVIVLYAKGHKFIGRLKNGKLIKGYSKDLCILERS